MKFLALAFLLAAVGANALPSQFIEQGLREERLVTNNIRRAIEEMSKNIREAGLDPARVEEFEHTEIIVPVLVNVNIVMKSVEFSGLSNMAINRLDYGALTNRLQFDISLPLLSLSIGNVSVRANVFGTRYTGSLSGTLRITQTRISGVIRVNIGIISGISLRNVDLNFRIDNIASNLSLIVQDQNYSGEVNTILNDTIPELLETNRAAIDQAISDFVKRVGNEALGKSLILGEQVLIA